MTKEERAAQVAEITARWKRWGRDFPAPYRDVLDLLAIVAELEAENVNVLTILHRDRETFSTWHRSVTACADHLALAVSGQWREKP